MKQNDVRLIGITGGIGAGKTMILEYVRRHYRCRVFLADETAHAVKEPGQPCHEKLVRLLGRGILLPDGRIDRAAMAARIFREKDLLEQVNAIIHPAVQRYFLDEVEQARQDPEVELLFIEAALLIETGYKELVDELWYIHAEEAVRRKRLGERERGYAPEEITRIMERQLPEEVFRRECDWVVENNGSAEECYQRIDQKLEAYTWQE
ncbi:MAG: dephospho-CoA kinase [Clostridium sp.]|jgi:dephospho-CoA kinase|nr:dephospho-CoA kinase [Clostridium sp.]